MEAATMTEPATDWTLDLARQHAAERARWDAADAEHMAARARLAEECGRLRGQLRIAQADLDAARRGAVKAGKTIAALRAYAGKLEDLAHAAGCELPGWSEVA